MYVVLLLSQLQLCESFREVKQLQFQSGAPDGHSQLPLTKIPQEKPTQTRGHYQSQRGTLPLLLSLSTGPSCPHREAGLIFGRVRDVLRWATLGHAGPRWATLGCLLPTPRQAV